MKTLEQRIAEIEENLKSYEEIDHCKFVSRHINNDNYIINGMQCYREDLRRAVKLIQELQEENNKLKQQLEVK